MTLWMMLSDRATTREAIRRLRSRAAPVAFLGEFLDSATALRALSLLQSDGLLLDTSGCFGRGAEWKSFCGARSEFTAWRWSSINHSGPSHSNARVSFSVLRPFQAPELPEWNRHLRATATWMPHITAGQWLARVRQQSAIPYHILSDLEGTLLDLLVSRATPEAISARLGISRMQIHNHLSNIRKQLLLDRRRPSTQSNRRLLVKLLPQAD